MKTKKSSWIRMTAFFMVLVLMSSSLTGCSGFFGNKTSKSDDALAEVSVENGKRDTETAEEEKVTENIELDENVQENLKSSEVTSKQERPVNIGTVAINDLTETLQKNSESSSGGESKKDTNKGSGHQPSGNLPTQKPSVPSGIVLEQSTVNLEAGMYSQLSVEGNQKEVAWTSSKESVATVSALGTVHALGEGTAIITASDGKQSASCEVIVSEPELELNHTELTMDLYGEETLVLSGTRQTPVWVSSETSVVSIDQNGKIEALGVGVAVIRADVKGRSISCNVKVKAPDSSDGSSVTVSRGEWIKKLLETVGYDVDSLDNDAIIWYYSDTKDCLDYGKEIEYAHMSGILPDISDDQNVPIFHPEEAATREFAAMTAVRALGFSVKEETLGCTDREDLEYEGEDVIAVRQALLFLDESNYFHPDRNLTVTEKEQILAVALNIKNSEAEIQNIAPGEIIKETVRYTPDTISRESLANTTYEVISSFNTDDKLQVVLSGADQVNIQKGNNLLLPSSEAYPSGLPFYVESAETQADGSIVVTGHVQKELSSILSDMQFTGSAKFDAENVQGLNGVNIQYDQNGSIDTSETSSYGGRFSKPIPGKLTFDFGDGIKINDHVKLEGKAEFEVPDVTIDADIRFGVFSGFTCNKFTASITEKMKVSGGIHAVAIESEFIPGEPGSIEIGRLPFQLGATGFSVDLVVSVYYSAEGEISIIYTLQATEGFQYKNGDLRFIGNVQQDVQLPTVEGKAEIGLKLAVNVVFMEIWDIIGLDNKIGPAVTVSLKNHVNTGLLCIDATLYLSSTIELNDETLIGDFLKDHWHYALEYQYWDENESPLKLKFHLENGNKVSSCTADRGDVKGRVVLSDGTALSNARVILKNGEMEIVREYTKNNGYYTLNNISEGTYTLIISADGYRTFANTIKVETGSYNQQEDIVMVPRDVVAEGSFYGEVKNATNAQLLDGFDCIVYKNWNNTTDNIVDRKSFSNGKYSFTLVPGNYTVQFLNEKYTPTHINVAVIGGNNIKMNDVLLSPKFNFSDTSMRIVLEWGATPRDLDSHLFGPYGNGSMFHTYYANKKMGSNWLDIDDTSSYGPETTTVECVVDGVYSFYVHNYSNRYSSNSSELSNSGAKVHVYFGNTYYTTIYIPANTSGTVWHVFDYDSRTDSFRLVNSMSYSSDPGSLGRTLTLDDTVEDDIAESDAIAEIVRVMLEDEKEENSVSEEVPIEEVQEKEPDVITEDNINE